MRSALFLNMSVCAPGCPGWIWIATAWTKVRHSPDAIISEVHGANGHMYT